LVVQSYTLPGFVLRMTPHASDGMWFIWISASFTNPRIRHITVAGALTGFSPAPATDPGDITTGSDGNLWFTSDDDDLVARMNPTTGAVVTFSHPDIVAPSEIIDGPGGDLWFAIRSGGRFGRIDPATGAIVTYRDPTDTVEGPTGLAFSGDGNLWYTRAIDLVGRLDLGTCQGQAVTVDLALGSRPTATNDVIRGTNGGNTIFAGGGNDLVCALGGNDKAYGGTGADRIYLGPGNDTGDGEANNDKVYGANGDDVVYLGSGADLGYGEDGRDIVLGEDGADSVDGGDDNDALSGGANTDACHGGAGSDTASSDCETRTGIP
jgi:Ca2+-binding RTX toxin-like protein